jgi:aspartyl-tRNA(Asn)/glutamyl-tRNA(Gln) amidotransferase subunit B
MPEGFETVIGLEVHCELSTATKLFCSCANAFGDEPNSNVCPVCLGLPGSLPVLNRRAVEFAIRIGQALGGDIRPSIFHRKNYFYPDMPKDYQISQYDQPISSGGRLALPDGSVVGIVRAHMEEDTGKSTHIGESGRIHGASHSLVDYNRAGVPLVEIVSEPDIRSAEQARLYVSELRAVLVATGASDGRMEEGSLRVDANVSIRPTGTTDLGTRCEVKNLNSLRSLVRAISYEAERQSALIAGGGTVSQQTRHWDEGGGVTQLLRSKEEAYDYRYFPEPDLVPLVPDDSLLSAAAAGVGKMPSERRQSLAELLGVPGEALAAGPVADQAQTVIELDLDGLVIGAVACGADAHLALARAANEGASKAEGARRLDAGTFAGLIKLESGGILSATQSKAVLSVLIDEGGEPAEIARRLGFEAMGQSDLDELVDSVIAANPDEWRRYQEGDDKISGFLLGLVMRQSSGKANGKLVKDTFDLRRHAGTASQG